MFDLEILTPEEEVYAGKASFLAARALDGEIGIMAKHAPLITVLAPGTIRYHLTDGKEVVLKGGDGLLKAAGDRVSILLLEAGKG